MAEPPLFAGALQVTVAVVSAAVADTPVGAPGAVAGGADVWIFTSSMSTPGYWPGVTGTTVEPSTAALLVAASVPGAADS